MQVYFTVNVGRHLGTQAGVHLIEGVCIIWGPFTGNTNWFHCIFYCYFTQHAPVVFSLELKKMLLLRLCLRMTARRNVRERKGFLKGRLTYPAAGVNIVLMC